MIRHTACTSRLVPPVDLWTVGGRARCLTQLSPCRLSVSPCAVILLDWDDTLLCSSFLSAAGLRLDSAMPDLSIPLDPAAPPHAKQAHEVAVQLRELETCVCQLLQQSIARSQRTLIVTNAEHGWVELSAQKFLPAVVPLLQSLTVISARTCFEHLFPDAPLKWKYYSMHSALVGGGFFGSDGRAHVDKHVLSFGDSHCEREAVRALCRGVPSTRIKTVKFSESPNAEQLRRQLELVVQCMEYITTHAGDLDLQLTVTMSANSPPRTFPVSAPAPIPAPLTKSIGESALLTTEAKDVPTPTHDPSSKQLQHEARGVGSMVVA